MHQSPGKLAGMADVVLFGATGYTGTLTAHALSRRQIDFAIAGRDSAKLDSLSAELGGVETRVAAVGDVEALVAALTGARALISCVGPFAELGGTAVEAALRARVHYLDSTGEGSFISRLATERDADAQDAGIALVPAMGFDEVPADVAASLATEGMERADLALTYAVPSTPSSGTARTVPSIFVSTGYFIENGGRVEIRAGDRKRYSPMPPPLGPKPAVAFPLSVLEVVPLHLDLNTFGAYVTTAPVQEFALRAALPFMRVSPVRKAIENVMPQLARLSPDQRGKAWTILAEARAGQAFRNVAVTGRDVYGSTAEFLAAGAARMAEEDFEGSGVMAPVQALGLDFLQKLLIEVGVTIDVYETE